MAQTSGWFSQRFGNYYTVRCEWSATQSVSNNSSTITMDLYITADSGYWLDPSWGTRTVWLEIDGHRSTYSPAASRWTVPSGGRSLLASKTRTVSHNNDGTKSLTFEYYADIMLTLNGTFIQSRTRSRDYTLTPIPRAPLFYVRANSRWNKAKGVWIRDNSRWNRSYDGWVRANSRWNKSN